MKWARGENVPLGTKLAPAVFWFPPRGQGGRSLSSEGQQGAELMAGRASGWPGRDVQRGGKKGEQRIQGLGSQLGTGWLHL
jgi:hypothetical protein